MSLRPSRTLHQLDSDALYVRLDKVRRERRMSWRAVSRATGVGHSTLSRIAYTQQIHGDVLLTLMVWAGLTDITGLTRSRPHDPTETA